jgi:hypothetical protein
LSWQETLLGGGLVLVGGVAGVYLTHHFELKRHREAREEERQERREDRRTDQLLAIQDDVTNLQEFFIKYSAKKRAGIESVLNSGRENRALVC